MGRVAQPEEIAPAVVHLSPDDSSYVLAAAITTDRAEGIASWKTAIKFAQTMLISAIVCLRQQGRDTG